MASADPTAPADGRACYVYGVVPADTRTPQDAGGIGDPPSPVSLVAHRRIAAVVSEIDPERPLGTPGDLRAHARVLDFLAAAGTPVLPFRFGAVVRDVEAVADELLAAQEQRFLAGLAELETCTQFTVRGTYRQERVLREILDGRPDIARLREQVAALPEDAAHYQRIQLGELVSQELTARGDADTERVMETLSPMSVRAVRADATPDRAVSASFLVPERDRKGFERAAEDLAAGWAGRMDLRLLGPLAPYDFVAQLVPGDEPWD